MATSPTPNVDEKAPRALEAGDGHGHGHEHGHKGVSSAARAVRDITSPRVARVEALSASITLADRICIFVGVFVLAYVYGLDGTLRYAYQPVASASFGVHSLQATINVVRSVIAAAAQPVSAKIADVFGRVELLCVAVVLYVVGTVVEATSNNIDTFAGGSVIYQIGYTMVILLVEVIIADISSTRARLFFSYIPALPFIINAWVSGNISEAVLATTTWRWGVGMWCIIFPVAAMPLILSLWLVSRRAKKEGRLVHYRSSFERLGFGSLTLELFWLLDIIGIILVIALFGLILVPLTLAGGFESRWRSAPIIVCLVLGILCIPGFILWELRAPHPLVPFSLIKDRAVWAPLGIAVFLNFAFTMQSDFLFTVLQVAFDFSVRTATRVVSLYSFTSVIVGPLLGLVVFKVRRLKMFVVAGTALYMVAFGLLIHYRGSPSESGRSGVIGTEPYSSHFVGAVILLGGSEGVDPPTPCTRDGVSVSFLNRLKIVVSRSKLVSSRLSAQLSRTSDLKKKQTHCQVIGAKDAAAVQPAGLNCRPKVEVIHPS